MQQDDGRAAPRRGTKHRPITRTPVFVDSFGHDITFSLVSQAGHVDVESADQGARRDQQESHHQQVEVGITGGAV